LRGLSRLWQKTQAKTQVESGLAHPRPRERVGGDGRKLLLLVLAQPVPTGRAYAA